uniref:RING-type E3 ubiquitin transferase n=1 Tax=Kalanchoe fedtschenkoi TaxID=63787 RepID=A0A7N0VMB6_KALFE
MESGDVRGAGRRNLVAVAVDKGSRSSREALRWMIDHHLVSKGQTVMLVHVNVTKSPPLPPYGKNELKIRREPDEEAMDVLTPYMCFCLLRQVECEPVVLQHTDVAAALRDFIFFYGVDAFVLGGVTRHRLARWYAVKQFAVSDITNSEMYLCVTEFYSLFATARIFRDQDVHTKLGKCKPSFCTVYGICNKRIKNSKSATHHVLHPPSSRVAAEETITPELAAADGEW